MFVGLSAMRAQQTAYQSKLLGELGKSIGYVPNDTLKAGTYEAGSVMGKGLVVEYDDHHTITHLGFRLFDDAMKKAYVSDVYNFLERYFLELYCWKDKMTLSQKIHDDKVMFTQGSIADLKNINESTPFAINRVENKYYQVTWSDNGRTILDVAFPIQYELLLGMPQAEIAKMMYDFITTAPQQEEQDNIGELELVKDNIYRTAPSMFYQLESLSACTYYYNKGDDATLVLDTINKDYSALNVFHKLTEYNNPMVVEQHLYGFNKTEYTITLQQWLNYCKEAKVTVYTAIEEEYEDGYKILLVAESLDMGYNHLLSILVPKNFMERPTAEFKVTMNAFIPTHNIKNLYQQYVGKSKKKIY